jgi:hypothetical protein
MKKILNQQIEHLVKLEELAIISNDALDASNIELQSMAQDLSDISEKMSTIMASSKERDIKEADVAKVEDKEKSDNKKDDQSSKDKSLEELKKISAALKSQHNVDVADKALNDPVYHNMFTRMDLLKESFGKLKNTFKDNDTGKTTVGSTFKGITNNVSSIFSKNARNRNQYITTERAAGSVKTDKQLKEQYKEKQKLLYLNNKNERNMNENRGLLSKEEFLKSTSPDAKKYREEQQQIGSRLSEIDSRYKYTNPQKSDREKDLRFFGKEGSWKAKPTEPTPPSDKPSPTEHPISGDGLAILEPLKVVIENEPITVKIDKDSADDSQECECEKTDCCEELSNAIDSIKFTIEKLSNKIAPLVSSNVVSDASTISNTNTNNASNANTNNASNAITNNASNANTNNASNASNAITNNASNTNTNNASNANTNNASNAITNNASNANTSNASNANTSNASNAITNNASNAITSNASNANTNNASNANTNNASNAITSNASNANTNNASNAITSNASTSSNIETKLETARSTELFQDNQLSSTNDQNKLLDETLKVQKLILEELKKRTEEIIKKKEPPTKKPDDADKDIDVNKPRKTKNDRTNRRPIPTRNNGRRRRGLFGRLGLGTAVAASVAEMSTDDNHTPSLADVVPEERFPNRTTNAPRPTTPEVPKTSTGRGIQDKAKGVFNKIPGASVLKNAGKMALRLAGPAAAALAAYEVGSTAIDAYDESFGEGGKKVVQDLHHKKIISYNFGDSEVLDWKGIQELPTEDLKKLIDAKIRFKPEDDAKLHEVLTHKLVTRDTKSEIGKPEVVKPTEVNGKPEVQSEIGKPEVQSEIGKPEVNGKPEVQSEIGKPEVNGKPEVVKPTEVNGKPEVVKPTEVNGKPTEVNGKPEVQSEIGNVYSEDVKKIYNDLKENNKYSITKNELLEDAVAEAKSKGLEIYSNIAMGEVKPIAQQLSLDKIKPETKIAPEAIKPKTLAPEAANVVYDKSAEVSKEASNTSTVVNNISAPTNNVTQHSTNQQPPMNPRNTESTISKFFQNRNSFY